MSAAAAVALPITFLATWLLLRTPLAYLLAFARAGVVVRRMERSDGWPPVPFGYFISRVPKVGMTVGTVAHLSAARYAGVSIYGRRR